MRREREKEEGIDPGERLALLLTGNGCYIATALVPPWSAKAENGKAGTKTDRLPLTYKSSTQRKKKSRGGGLRKKCWREENVGDKGKVGRWSLQC